MFILQMRKLRSERLHPSHGWKVVLFLALSPEFLLLCHIAFIARMCQVVICRKEVPECGAKMRQKHPHERPGNKTWHTVMSGPPSLFPGTPLNIPVFTGGRQFSVWTVWCVRRLQLVWPQRGCMGVEKKNERLWEGSKPQLADVTVSPAAGPIHAPPWFQKSFPLRTLMAPTAPRLKNFMEMWKF